MSDTANRQVSTVSSSAKRGRPTSSAQLGGPTFECDPRIAKDSLWLQDLALSELRLQRDARFFWLVLVPKRATVREWFELPEREQATLHAEIMHWAQRLKAVSGADKINIGALGNVVPQLHVHIIARHFDDACWPGPVWGSTPQVASETLMQQRQSLLLRP
jgi:diadenosine tetraphosphate (Ap4A) HIT family hydrolase